MAGGDKSVAPVLQNPQFGHLRQTEPVAAGGDVAETVKLAAAVFGAVVAATTILRGLGTWWKAGPGRRREWMRKYRLLAPQVHIDYVREMFGQPAFQERSKEEGSAGSIGYVWFLDHEGYLHVLTDADGEVVSYSITTNSSRFRPRLPIGSLPNGKPAFTVKLGVTRFADIGRFDNCAAVYHSVGARRYEYRELYYFGNPGGYFDWVCAHNDAGRGPFKPLFWEEDLPAWWPRGDLSAWLDTLDSAGRARLDAARQGTVVNTVTISSGLGGDAGPYGPDHDRVRMVARRRPVAQRLTLRR
ncbi:ETEC_3214 domain-containing protein [Asanoa siamensis]|uniref:Uncharacterized protein n=1 Tax=Asanoa siamensis TaxID=926357 RepID=A0ABQ4D4F0_9ACTN|nr:ETEC_3214 domain-containing protein [Asanoa siamensis]GIF78416.1 hypothetical protein Asi02nite_79340 [Asanoa siamensis]